MALRSRCPRPRPRVPAPGRPRCRRWRTRPGHWCGRIGRRALCRAPRRYPALRGRSPQCWTIPHGREHDVRRQGFGALFALDLDLATPFGVDPDQFHGRRGHHRRPQFAECALHRLRYLLVLERHHAGMYSTTVTFTPSAAAEPRTRCRWRPNPRPLFRAAG